MHEIWHLSLTILIFNQNGAFHWGLLQYTKLNTNQVSSVENTVKKTFPTVSFIFPKVLKNFDGISLIIKFTPSSKLTRSYGHNWNVREVLFRTSECQPLAPLFELDLLLPQTSLVPNADISFNPAANSSAASRARGLIWSSHRSQLGSPRRSPLIIPALPHAGNPFWRDKSNWNLFWLILTNYARVFNLRYTLFDGLWRG